MPQQHASDRPLLGQVQSLRLELCLAERIGLVPACLDGFLRACIPGGREQLLSLRAFEQALPFLATEDIVGALESLQREGRIQMGIGGDGLIPLSLCTAPESALPAKEKMHLKWHPSEETVQLMEQQEIPESFWKAQLIPFRLYYREKGLYGPFEYRFLSWTNRGWQWQQSFRVEEESEPNTGWQPDAGCIARLEKTGIDRNTLAGMQRSFCADKNNLKGDSARIQAHFESHAAYQWQLICLQNEMENSDNHSPQKRTNPAEDDGFSG